MLLLWSRRPDSEPVLVSLFGVGLVGSSIRDSLVRRGFQQEFWEYPWGPGTDVPGSMEPIRSRIESLVGEKRLHRIRFLWSAGKAGFESNSESIQAELRIFRGILACATEMAVEIAGVETEFWMISSIGGLFEGQRFVDGDSEPRPLRPYGRLKMEQEDALFRVDSSMGRRVFRLTSVFGAPSGSARRGLIPTVIANTKKRLVTKICGRMDTLRDYTWVADIGRYISEQLSSCSLLPSERRVETLSSGRPSSIHEVLNIIANKLDETPLIQFDQQQGNSLDITVAHGVRPLAFQATDLETAIREILLEMS